MRTVPKLILVLSFFLIRFFAQAQITADFSMDRLGGCSPLNVNFSNRSTGISATAKFSWDLGNGNRSTLQNPSAIYTEEKNYTIILTVTDGTQTATKTKTITVYKKPVVDFSAVAPKVCLPASAQFISASTAGDGTVTSYQWDFGDGVTQQSFSNTISHAYSYEQMATVSLTVANSHGCQASKTKQNIVEILPKINPVFTVNKTMLCSLADSIKLTNTSTGPGTLQYLWNFGDGTTSTAANPSHKYNAKGIYQVRLTVSNTVGCSVTSSNVQINAAFFNTDFTSRPLCREVNFTATSYLFPTNSSWQFGDGSTPSTSSSASHTYATAGTYNVTLINTYGVCKDTITKPVTVQEVVTFNSGITMPASVCLNTNATFTSTSSTIPSLIKWDFGDGYVYNTNSPTTTHTYPQPGTYTVKMINVFGTCSETVTKTIVVNALPNLQGFIADYGGVCGSPVTVTFRDTTTGAVAWQWWMDNFFGTPFSTLQNAPYLFSFNGNHTVYLTVTNAAGCKRTVSKQVNISSPSASIYITQSSSPKGYYDCDSLTL